MVVAITNAAAACVARFNLSITPFLVDNKTNAERKNRGYGYFEPHLIPIETTLFAPLFDNVRKKLANFWFLFISYCERTLFMSCKMFKPLFGRVQIISLHVMNLFSLVFVQKRHGCATADGGH